MHVRKNPVAVSVMVCLTFALPVAGPAKEKHGGVAVSKDTGRAVLWTDPEDIQSRDLFYGPGGSSHVPQGPFTFVKEDLEGTNPKFDVKDQDGTKWKAKMGNEARPETVAARIVWAVGYSANEDYFVPEIKVDGMPARLHRGWKLVGADGTISNVRLKREGEKKVGTWAWRQDAFTGTREMNGLRTLMAVINNWDLKDENNAIYKQGDQRVYMISDLGASFGCPGRCWPMASSKGDLQKYNQSGFIRQTGPETVSFQAPARPRFMYAVNPKEYLRRIHLEWIGRNVPRSDAKWMGELLARLSQRQIQDAFRAAGYSQQDVEQFASVLQRRISALTDL